MEACICNHIGKIRTTASLLHMDCYTFSVNLLKMDVCGILNNWQWTNQYGKHFLTFIYAAQSVQTYDHHSDLRLPMTAYKVWPDRKLHGFIPLITFLFGECAIQLHLSYLLNLVKYMNQTLDWRGLHDGLLRCPGEFSLFCSWKSVLGSRPPEARISC